MSGCGADGSALPWGGRGRGFKSRHSDQKFRIFKPKLICGISFFLVDDKLTTKEILKLKRRALRSRLLPKL